MTLKELSAVANIIDRSRCTNVAELREKAAALVAVANEIDVETKRQQNADSASANELRD